MATMENNHVSKWFDVQSVPQSHTYSIDLRPGNDPIPTCNKIPIIDLQRDDEAVQQIIEASQEYGLFLVINHGVSEDVIEETAQVMEELFGLPQEELSKDAKETGWVYFCSTNFVVAGAYLWRDNIKHTCHPLKDCVQRWPRHPIRYRDVVEAYVKNIERLSLKILEMICQGLGLEKDHLGSMSEVKFLSANNYPPCPDPSLALGVIKHHDHNLITILYQGNIEGLQIMKDGEWIGVEAPPNSFVVNIGSQLQIISNGKLKSIEHRAVPNLDQKRITIATFVNPKPESVIEPAKILVNKNNPARYSSTSFKDFVDATKPFGPYTHVLQNDEKH
ncbi:hyoscyamine 6-dioxygenase-like [Andrographis paniculata]|uniref:hyoscyamine 6-dioxygenase-like n=1 Tax=Andrographis paniculata TaxID=175694 RepID=UPI0021E72059|nr:hyoscyamine 6-dioxygenase-like [Andrographis paniculata]